MSSSYNSIPSIDSIKAENRSIYLGMFQAWSFGISMVMSGLFFGFNPGFSAGFGGYMTVAMIMGLAYICFACSMAEIMSGLPFAGGAYGLARLSLGFYPGFLIGCLEAMEYIFFTSAIMTSFSDMLVESYGLEDYMVPILSLIGYIVAVTVHLCGPRAFWTYTCTLAVVTVLLLLVYCFGSLAFVNFNQYSVPETLQHSNPPLSLTEKYFIGGGNELMRIFYVSSWLYIGIEATGFINDTIEAPTKSIPRGYVAAIVTLFLLSIFMLMVLSSLPPDLSELPSTLLPLNPGYQLIFNISPQAATLLSLPATYTAAFQFIYPYSRLLVALASSNLFPSYLKGTWSNGVHYAAILTGSLVSYAACVVYYFSPELLGYTFSVCTLATFVIYISQLIGYYRFVTIYSSIDRDYRSPVQLWGAAYAGCVFIVGSISIIVFEETHYSLIAIIVLLALESIYYYLSVMKKQIFSEEESRIMYLCHMINIHIQDRNHHSRSKSHASILPVNYIELHLHQLQPQAIAVGVHVHEKDESKSHDRDREDSSSKVFESNLSWKGPISPKSMRNTSVSNNNPPHYPQVYPETMLYSTMLHELNGTTSTRGDHHNTAFTIPSTVTT